MTEAADRVTDYAFRDLGWPHLWLTNAQENHASRRIKEKQGARLIDLRIGHCVSGQVTADGLAAPARGLAGHGSPCSRRTCLARQAGLSK